MGLISVHNKWISVHHKWISLHHIRGYLHCAMCISPYTNSCSIFVNCKCSLSCAVSGEVQAFSKCIYAQIPQNTGFASWDSAEHGVCILPSGLRDSSSRFPRLTVCSTIFNVFVQTLYLSILIFLRIMIPWIIFLARYVRIVHCRSKIWDPG